LSSNHYLRFSIVATPRPMSILLQKGQSYSFDESRYDLSSITVGLGWDPRKEPERNAQWKKWLSSKARKPFDLDAIAFLLDQNTKIRNLGYSKEVREGQMAHLVNSDVVYFNNLRHPGGAVYHTGDNRTGDGSGDVEQIIVRIRALDPLYHKIIFLASIFEGNRRRQHFSMIDNAFIRAVDAQGREMVRYNLSHDETYEKKCTMLFGEVARGEAGWQFRALGEALETDEFPKILENYV
jgi:tellurium resistance protein TerD